MKPKLKEILAITSFLVIAPSLALAQQAEPAPRAEEEKSGETTQGTDNPRRIEAVITHSDVGGNGFKVSYKNLDPTSGVDLSIGKNEQGVAVRGHWAPLPIQKKVLFGVVNVQAGPSVTFLRDPAARGTGAAGAQIKADLNLVKVNQEIELGYHDNLGTATPGGWSIGRRSVQSVHPGHNALVKALTGNKWFRLVELSREVESRTLLGKNGEGESYKGWHYTGQINLGKISGRSDKGDFGLKVGVGSETFTYGERSDTSRRLEIGGVWKPAW